jgi:hypothetical protein
MISPEEINGQTGVMGRALKAIADRTTQIQGKSPSYIFLGTSEMTELKTLAAAWEHEWPIPGIRPKIGAVPIYVVDEVTFLAVI